MTLLLEYVSQVSNTYAVVSTGLAEYAVRTIVFRRRAEFWDDAELYYLHTTELLRPCAQTPIAFPYDRRELKFERCGNDDIEQALRIQADILEGPTIVTSYAGNTHLLVFFEDFDFSLMQNEKRDGIELCVDHYFQSNLIPDIKIPAGNERHTIVEEKERAQKALIAYFKARHARKEANKMFAEAQDAYRELDPNQILLGQYNQVRNNLNGGVK